jgi:hypothetical protein
LGPFVLEDFRSTIERALGVEVQDDYTKELRVGDQSLGQKAHKGHFGCPIQKKDKHHCHQPYGGSSSQSRASGGGSRDSST